MQRSCTCAIVARRAAQPEQNVRVAATKNAGKPSLKPVCSPGERQHAVIHAATGAASRVHEPRRCVQRVRFFVRGHCRGGHQRRGEAAACDDVSLVWPTHDQVSTHNQLPKADDT